MVPAGVLRDKELVAQPCPIGHLAIAHLSSCPSRGTFVWRAVQLGGLQWEELPWQEEEQRVVVVVPVVGELAVVL